MTSRRRLLQIIASSFKWIAHSFTNLYYSLIPTTISGKKVQDKAKVVKVYGNSEVKNQLIINGAIHGSYQSWTIDNSQGSSALYATQQWNCDSSYRLTIGHKYLIWFVGTKSYSGNGACRLYPNVANQQAYVFDFKTQNANIITINSIEAPTSTPTLNTIVGANTTLTVDGFLCFTDLTQRYPFDTPTTLADTRVQKILNGGYEEYNLGEIVDVDMGEIDSEPYNLLVSQPTYNSSVVSFNSQTFTKLMANKPYTLEFENLINATQYRWCLSFYNENGEIINDIDLFTFSIAHYFNQSGLCLTSNNIPASTKTLSITPKVNCYIYVNIGLGDVSVTTVMNNVCLHLTGTRTGYADHDDFVDLANFKPTDVMGIKDTFLANSVGYKITKKTASYTFTGNEIIITQTVGSITVFRISFPTSVSSIIKPATSEYTEANILISNYSANRWGSMNVDMSFGMYTNGNFIRFRNDSCNGDIPTFQSAITGKTITYELATYQIINIPLRHLGMAKIRDLSWSYNSGGAYFYATVNSIKLLTSDSTILNAYIGKYMNVNYNDFYSNPKNYTLSQSANSNLIRVKDTQYDNVTDFINAMGDEYIYFETADVIDETGIIIDKGNLSLSYQGAGVGTAHDTMEQTDTEWVFTKAMNEYTFTGSESWTQWSYERAYTKVIASSVKIPSGTDYLANALLDNYQIYYQNNLQNVDKSFCIATNGNINVRDVSNIANIQSIMAGHTIKFELATPQVIRIPRKHLGVVNLGSLTNWGKNVAYSHNETVNTGIQSLIKKVSGDTEKANMYCVKYTTNSRNAISNMQISINALGTIIINDSELYPLTSEQIQAKLSGIYLFYETQDEVADIDLTILVEAGGTLTSNWFSWVRNQLVNMATDYPTQVTVDSDKLGFSLPNTISTSTYAKPMVIFTKGHKYLVMSKITGTFTRLNWWLNNAYTKVYYLLSETSPFIFEYNVNETSTGVIDVIGEAGASCRLQCIDLTEGFGAGKEPTNINDPVIKEILRLGYIPTDVSGTLTNVDSKVLPDIDCKIKCK